MLTEKQKLILKLLLTNKEGYNVNQIARILNISVSWTHEALKILEKEGILMSEKRANALLFRINWVNPKAEKVCEFILLDTKPKVKDTEEAKEEKPKETPKPSYAQIYNTIVSQGYSSVSSPIIDSPYRQASTDSFSSSGYNVAPVGDQGVNNVLSAYASQGAFGSSSGYSPASSYSSIPVPPGTLGSRISSNTSAFTLPMHTSQHKTVNTPGCRYCGPEIKL